MLYSQHNYICIGDFCPPKQHSAPLQGDGKAHGYSQGAEGQIGQNRKVSRFCGICADYPFAKATGEQLRRGVFAALDVCVINVTCESSAGKAKSNFLVRNACSPKNRFFIDINKFICIYHYKAL